MKQIVALFIGSFLFISPSLAEKPCDFKGVSVGDKMSPAELMSALGVTNYKTNPARPSSEHMKALVERFGVAAIEDDEFEPYCDDTSCRIPYGVAVGNMNRIPVKVSISFHDGLIIEIVVKFGEMYWDEMLPILDQKYGGNWKVKREDTVVTNYENKKSQMVQGIYLEHVTNGTNPSTKDHCKIWANNLDLVYEHHDVLGPYHSEFVIQLISKNF